MLSAEVAGAAGAATFPGAVQSRSFEMFDLESRKPHAIGLLLRGFNTVCIAQAFCILRRLHAFEIS